MHRYEFRAGPYDCVPFGQATAHGLFIGAVRVSRRVGEEIETEVVQYADRSFHAESDARAYAKQRFNASVDNYLPSQTNFD